MSADSTTPIADLFGRFTDHDKFCAAKACRGSCDCGLSAAQERIAAFDVEHAAAPEALDVLQELFGLLEAGVLVRDISKDMEPGFALKAMKLVMVLKRGQEVLTATRRLS
jgi:hypothetical protein